VESLTAVHPVTLDCEALSVREINRVLRALPDGSEVRLVAPRGRHNLAVGIEHPLSITVDGFVGWSVGENLMGGTIRIRGSASQSAGASACGGTIVVEGDASLRAGISLKGGTVAVAGDAGAMSGFMAQAGTILIGGNAGAGLGDSLYEAVIYVAGRIDSLGADARVEELTEDDVDAVKSLVAQTGFDHIAPGDVTRVGSARQLYHFRSEHHGAY
jgi:formylmethanofuran dehydrogenase subunit C